MDEPTCPLIEDGVMCGRPVYIKKRGWCKMHYRRWERHRDPLKRLIGGDPQVRVESLVDRSGGPDACHPWRGSLRTDGYGCVLVDDKRKKAHVAVWEFANGPKPAGIDLDHECHNQAVRDGLCRPGKCMHRLCCNLNHIIARTKREHFSATVPWDRTAWARSAAKLTASQVRDIREAVRSGTRVRVIAGQYGLSRQQVYRIKRGEAWGWLPAS